MSQKPSYDLRQIQAKVREQGIAAFTSKAIATGQDELGMTTAEMIAMILARQDRRCYKTMPSTIHPGQMQDVYHWPTPTHKMAYVKFSLGPQGKVVVSFKEK
jgi:hypothetical protein